MTIIVNGVEIALESLPALLDAMDGALIIDKRQHVLRVTRDGKEMLITDLTEKGFLASAWNTRETA